MNVKRSLVAIAATGATAAVVFGGSAVATSFSSTSAQQFAEGQGATTGVAITNGSFDATNLVPGDPAQALPTIDIHNGGSVKAEATITFGDYTVKTPGSNGGNPNPADLILGLNGTNNSEPATQIADHTFDLGPIASGGDLGITPSEALAAGTSNDWNGADAFIPYTVTLTAGSDPSLYQRSGRGGLGHPVQTSLRESA